MEQKLKKRRVHIVPHTHWDLEWYFDIERSIILFLNNMDSVIETLEKDKKFNYYTLDGQTVLLDLYLEHRPENFNRIKKLVEQGKLIVGPWYTQSSQNNVHGESLVRNLLYGISDSKKFGKPNDVGYIPDSFGQTEQLPQILNNFNINKAVFWRGVSSEQSKNLTFNWGHKDGKSSVKVANIRFGYALGKYLPTEDEKIAKRLKTFATKLNPYVGDHEYVLGNGHDQMPIQVNLVKALNKINKKTDANFVISNFSKFIDDQDFSIAKTYVGELMDAEFSRIHRTMLSSRMDIKVQAFQLENKLIHVIEPLSVIVKKLGLNPEMSLIKKAWKQLLVNNSHDTLGGCISDDAANNALERFSVARRIIDSLEADYMRKIAMSVNNDKEKEMTIAFNLLNYKATRKYQTTIFSKKQHISLKDFNGKNVEFKLLETGPFDKGFVNKRLRVNKELKYYKHVVEFDVTIGAFGYKAFEVVDAKTSNVFKPASVKTISNDFYNITINSNGTLDIKSKKTNELFKNQLMLISESNVGDTYDYSPNIKNNVFTSKDVKAKVDIKDFKDYVIANVSYDWKLPKNIQSRDDNKADGKINISYTLKLSKGNELIDFKFNIDNSVENQRIRMIFDTKISNAKTQSGLAYGQIVRSDVMHGEENWVEKKIPVYPFINTVIKEDKGYSFGFVSNSIREYETIKEKMHFTLLTGASHLGLSDLPWRPGRSSGLPFPTPNAQLKKVMSYEFGIAILEKRNAANNLFKLFNEQQTENIQFNKRRDMEFNLNTDIKQKNTNPEFSLFDDLKMNNVNFESLKLSEDEKSAVIKFANIHPNKSVKINKSFAGFVEYKMDEQTKQKSTKEFAPLEVKTWLKKI